jgi:hypothetical protein
MLFGELETAIDVSIDLGFVIPVVGECGVDLAELEVGILEVKFGRTPAIGEMGGDEFNHFHGASGNVRDGHPASIEYMGDLPKDFVA